MSWMPHNAFPVPYDPSGKLLGVTLPHTGPLPLSLFVNPASPASSVAAVLSAASLLGRDVLVDGTYNVGAVTVTNIRVSGPGTLNLLGTLTLEGARLEGVRVLTAAYPASGQQAGEAVKLTGTRPAVVDCQFPDVPATLKQVLYVLRADGYTIGRNRITGGRVMYGVFAEASSKGRVHGNDITGPDNGVFLWCGNADSYSDVEVEGNVITAPASHGVTVWGGDAKINRTIRVRRLRISGNSVTNAGGCGIWANNTDGVTCTGNTVEGCGLEGLDWEGVTNATITGNTVKNAVAGGLAFLYGCRHITATGNSVTLDLPAGPATPGSAASSAGLMVYIRDDCTDLTVSGNVFTCTREDAVGEIRFWRNSGEAGRLNANTPQARVTLRGNTLRNVVVNVLDGVDGLDVCGNTFRLSWQYRSALVCIRRSPTVFTDNVLHGPDDATLTHEVVVIEQGVNADAVKARRVSVERNQFRGLDGCGMGVQTWDGTNPDGATVTIRDNLVQRLNYNPTSGSQSVVERNAHPKTLASLEGKALGYTPTPAPTGLSAAPTAADFNGLLAKLKTAGILT